MIGRLAGRAATWFHSASALFDSHYSRRSHVLMTTSDGREGFALFGGFRARHRFGALYLDSSQGTRTRLVVHQPVTATYCRELVRRHGLVVFCGGSAPHSLASELLSIPISVDLESEMPECLEGPRASWNRSAKANIARVKKGGFSFEIAKGAEWVPEFYQRMFLPAMRDRHGLEAVVDTPRALVRYLQAPGGEMLRVFQGGQWVASLINQSTPDTYRLLKLGWLNGDQRLLKSGVVSALYWFGLQRAAALGHRRMAFGSAAPHLEDGVLLYKTHWGAHIAARSRDFGRFDVFLDPSHPTCRRFLRAYSTITMGTDRELIVFSARKPGELDIKPEALRHVKRWYLWRDEPLAVPEITSAEVPGPLRCWVTLHVSPSSNEAAHLQR